MPSPIRRAPAALALCLLAAAPAHLQGQAHDHAGMAMPEEGLRAELIRDVDQLGEKYLALAEALEAHYAWRPREGVRSVSEVLMHVAYANVMIPSMAGVDAPAAFQGRSGAEVEATTDPAELREALAHSFRHARHAIARVPDGELDATATLFGQVATKRAVLVLTVTHMHEHLGQAVAYARTVGVVPPWSAQD